MASHVSFPESVEESFIYRAPLLGALCGILVLEIEDGSGFVEKARFGYEEDGYFYEFMARGNGNLEMLRTHNVPVIFSGKEYPLYSPTADFAVASGLYRGDGLKGFLVMEMKGKAEEALNMVFLLSRFLDEKQDHLPVSQQPPLVAVGFPKEESKEFMAIKVLTESEEGLRSGMKILQTKSIILILGPQGSGKKTLARFLHRSRKCPGNIIVINTFPENLGKLERSILEWEELAKPEGVLVFDCISLLSIGQQRIFFEWLENTTFKGKIIFVDQNEKGTEGYKPFWDKFEFSTISMPSLNSVSKPVLEDVIDMLFFEICNQNGREGLSLSPIGKEKLKFSPLLGNLEELKNILSYAIWRSKGREVDLDIVDDGRIKNYLSMEFPPADDLDLPKCIKALEKQKILIAENLFSGNQSRMAKALKLSRGSLQYKMKNLGL